MVDVGYEKIAIAEARKLGIPIVAIVDSNNSPENVDYVIPGNDDAVRAIQLYVDAAAESIQAGKQTAAITDSKEYVEVKEPVVEAAPAAEAPAKEEAKKEPAAAEPAVADTPAEAPAAEAPVAAPEASAKVEPAAGDEAGKD